MSYPYSEVNRLETPHSYMYTPYGGANFLKGYFESRRTALRLMGPGSFDPPMEFDRLWVRAISSFLGERVGSLFSDEEGVRLFGSAQLLSAFKISEPVETYALLESLLSDLLLISIGRIDATDDSKTWMDRLVQRFEVTKKLSVSYLPGFRKGEGARDQVELYCRFSLALVLFYRQTRDLKYLSTLLKVNDLLCSLPIEVLDRSGFVQGLGAALGMEMRFVDELSETQGVHLDAH